MRTLLSFNLLLACCLSLQSCTGVPDGVTPVTPFELNRYLGEWHEIARLDHRFERGLTEVTANYAMRDDGGVKVINRGFNAAEGDWQQAEGKAYFVGDTNTGALKVSFFGPFYGGYNIAKLNDDYSVALVVGPSTDYAWLLARSKTPAKALCDDYMAFANSIGISAEQWIWLQQCR
ncbi:lipocalin family protein [Rheinheimera sp. YQF-2]|uniref:Outer membrane lipoprotein Blc n=1 Tax=Rheinheimera lutimaris TaxID=2740584 RepID=A0A7Y5ATN0_9GAMM|nr:lipocalin family protein [Rheinheimera lutimaris]NRQ44149.1 lipocalin family protein [Rheinheimera lutimaris]